MKNKLNLPKSKEVNGVQEPYISYSQYTSFNEDSDEFRYQMILQYIFGIKTVSRFEDFAVYGNHCGEYIETKGEKRGDMLSDNDCKILDDIMKDFSKDCEYEREVWIPRPKQGYNILGYQDRWEPLGVDDNGFWCNVEDFKTGSIERKRDKYLDESYGQTTLYSYYEEAIKGHKVEESYVTMLDRAGNPMHRTNPTKLYLTGKTEKLPTPYSIERAERLLKKIDDTAIRLASLKTTFEALKDLTVEF